MWIVRLALRRPYTFIVMAMLIAIGGVLTIARTPTDIFPEINIPVISVIWQFTGLSPNEVEGRMVTISERAMTTTVNSTLLVATAVATGPAARAGQAPGAASEADVPVNHRDRVYAAEQFSKTVSVTDPADNKLLGVIRLGDPAPGNLSPLYRGQLLVHGMGFSPDHRTIAGCLDRLEFGDLHRHGNQCREARHLRRTLTARGILHAGRSRGLGDGPWRELRIHPRRPHGDTSAGASSSAEERPSGEQSARRIAPRRRPLR
jgi:hypothetical protein